MATSQGRLTFTRTWQALSKRSLQIIPCSRNYQLAILRRLVSAQCACSTAQVQSLHTSSSSSNNSSKVSSTSQQSPNIRHSSKHTVDYTILAACCHELTGSWVPSKVEEVVQSDRFTLSLRLRTPLSQGWLHLSWHPTAARVCLGQPPHRGDVTEAFSFAEQASNHLKGLVLLSAHLPVPWERVVQLDFGTRPGDAPSRRVFCEVMAKYSNVVLTAADGAVLVCGYQVGGSMSSLRQVQQGRPYQLPPVVNGIPPSAAESQSSWQHNITQAAAMAAAERGTAVRRQAASTRTQQHLAVESRSEPHSASAAVSAVAGASSSTASVSAGATRAYRGVSPALMEELCIMANLLHTAHPDSLTSQDWCELHSAWLTWLDKLHTGKFTPTSCPSTGKFSVLGTYSQNHGSVHDMVDAYFYSLQAGEVYSSLHQRLSAAVKQAVKKAKGKVYSFQQQLSAAEGATAVQKQADLIVANLYRIPAKSCELVTEDWETGGSVTVQLDPTKTPMEVAEGLYKRARKLRRAVDAVRPLLEAAQQDLEYLESVECELSQLPPGGDAQELAALREVQDELVESKVIKPPPEAALSAKAAAKGRKAQKRTLKSNKSDLSPALAAAAAAAGGAGLRRFSSPGGFVVLVGRNNKQNDVLSHQIAKPGDIWMHVRGLPGSHTVIRLESGQHEPSEDDLQFAADLAAWFSKARDAGKVDVIVARAEHLKKFKGAKPGQVLVSKEEGNIVARPGQSAAAANDSSSDL